MIENLNDIVTDVQARHKAFPNSGSIKVDGLTIGLHGESSNLSHWLKTMAGFASHDTSLPDLSSHAIGVTCCDATICSIATLLTSTTECQTYSRGNESVLRSKIGADVVLDYFPYLGAAWIGSASLQTTEYVYSSRTPFPHLELRLGFVDLINQYMESRGWHSLHSGACRIGEHIVLIVGDSGAGKTTLISRLVLENATYIANERVFVRCSDSDVHVHGFPQTISVGLGTAAQFPGLSQFVDRPDRLAYFQKRFNAHRVWSTPPTQRHDLPDKLKFLPHEFTSALGSPIPESGGTVDGIVVPKLRPPEDSRCRRLGERETHDVLSRNYFDSKRDLLYPRFLSTPFVPRMSEANDLLKSLLQLPSWEYTFSTDDVPDFPGFQPAQS